MNKLETVLCIYENYKILIGTYNKLKPIINLFTILNNIFQDDILISNPKIVQIIIKINNQLDFIKDDIKNYENKDELIEEINKFRVNYNRKFF